MRNPFQELSKWLKNPRNKLYFTVVYATMFAWLIFPLFQHVILGKGNQKVNTIKELPFESINYNGKYITLESAENTSHVSKSGYGFVPEATLKFDLSGLSEKDIYWLIKNDDLSLSCMLVSEKNDISEYMLENANSEYKNKELTITFTVDDIYEFKHSFENAVFLITFNVKQDEKEKRTVNNLSVYTNKFDIYSYSIYNSAKKA